MAIWVVDADFWSPAIGNHATKTRERRECRKPAISWRHVPDQL